MSPVWAGSPLTAPFAPMPTRSGKHPSCSNQPGGLLPLKLAEQQRLLTALVEFGKVVLHARLAAPAAGIDAGAFQLVVRFAGLGNRRAADQGISARCRELGEMLSDAPCDPAFAGPDLRAHPADVLATGLPRWPLLSCGLARRGERQQRCRKPEPSDLGQAARRCRPDHSPARPASRSPGKYVASAKARILGWSNQVDFATRSRLA